MPCETYEGGVTVCRPGRTEEIVRRSEGERWCFVERKRREFFFVVTREVEPSYYGPWPSVQCGSCGGQNADLFPGYDREWEE